MGQLFLLQFLLAGGIILHNFQMALYFNSLQKNSNLPPQEGDYLKDSFRTEVLVPFSHAMVTTLAKLDNKVTAIETSSLTYRVSFISTLLALALAVVTILLKKSIHKREGS